MAIGSEAIWRLCDILGVGLKSPKTTTTRAVVTNIELDGTIWVLLDGSTQPTPISQSLASVSPGDVVTVTISGGRATIGGSTSNMAVGVRQLVPVARTANRAYEDAMKVHDLTTDQLTAATAYIGTLTTQDLTATNLMANVAKVADLTAEQLSASTAYIAALTSGSVTASQIIADHAKVGTLDSEYAHITNGVIDNAKIGHADVNGLDANYATISSLNAQKGRIDTLVANTADIDTIRANSAKVVNLTAQQLEADHATIGTLDTNYMRANMSNSDVAWIQNGTIRNGAIVDAMIGNLSASKLTAGTINGSVINVTNLNADNITAGTINGQRIGQGSLSLDKLADDVYTEAEVDALLSTMQSQIDGAIETWTGATVPTLNNAPASDWTTDAIRETHIGDVYFLVNPNAPENGYNYRFMKVNNVYQWQLIEDSDVTAALRRLDAAEGKITTFETDITDLKTDTGTLKTKTQNLETSLGDKVSVATFNEVSDTVASHTQSITNLSNTVTQKADGSTVTALANRVTQTEQGVGQVTIAVSELSEEYESVSSVADDALEAAKAYRYENTFSKSGGTYTFTAKLMSGTDDVTSTVPQDRFVWWLRNEDGERFWSRGPSLTISEEEAGYRGSVIGGYEDEDRYPDLALASSSGLTFVTEGGDRIVARASIGEMNG